MKIRLKAALFVGIASTAISCPALAEDTKAFDVAAADNWQSIEFASISDDEQWVAQYIRPSSSLAELLGTDREATFNLYPELRTGADRLYCTVIVSDGKSKTYEICASGGVEKAQFSRDGRWFAALRTMAVTEPENGEADESGEDMAPPPSEVVLLNLQTGEQSVFKDLESFEFAGDQMVVLSSGDSPELSAMSLTTRKFTPLGAAKSYALNRDKSQIAWIRSAKDGFGNGVYVSATTQLASTQLDGSEMEYSGLDWADTGDALVVSRSPFPKGPDSAAENSSAVEMEPDVSVFAAWGIGTSQATSVVIDNQTPGFLAGKVISADTAYWNADRSAILLSLSDRRTAALQKRMMDGSNEGGGEGTGGESEPGEEPGFKTPNLALWHWNQAGIPDQESQSNEQPETRYYPSIFRPSTGRLVPLLTEADPREMELPDFTKDSVTASSEHLVVTQQKDPLAVLLAPHANGAGPKDVLLVDLKTGQKRPILKQVTALNGFLSPNGRFFSYYDQQNHHIYDIDEGRSYNLTEKLGRNFSNSADDNFDQEPVQPARWTKSGGLLLKDQSDVWFVANPANGMSDPVNLTVDGQDRDIDYTPISIEMIDDVTQVSSELPIFSNARLAEDKPMFHAFDRRKLQSGFAKLSAAGTGLEWVRPLSDKALQGGSDFYAVQSFQSSKGTRLLFQEQDMTSSAVYIAGSGLGDAKQIFLDDWNATPLRKQYAKPAGVRILNYACTWGKQLSAALVLPHNYRAGQKYPMVTIMYEWGVGGTAIGARDYFQASLGENNPVSLASMGYAVLLADVAFEPKNPGISSTQCLLPAVDAAVATGVVDDKRIGVHGHSWGGYQTFFTTTQTNRFAAAIAGAGLTDLISMWGGVYWGGLIAQHPLIEKGQGRMVDTIWDNWDGYLQNSPLYHARNLQTPMLIMHNDKDSAVGFYQGHEYFLALRRLRKPAVMLQYRGEDHGLEMRANRIDYRQRSNEFWDHFLKSAPAPDWWAKGVTPFAMEEHIRARFPEPESAEATSDEAGAK